MLALKTFWTSSIVAGLFADLDGIRDIEARALGVLNVELFGRSACIQEIPQLLVVDLQQLHPDAILDLHTVAMWMHWPSGETVRIYWRP